MRIGLPLLLLSAVCAAALAQPAAWEPTAGPFAGSVAHLGHGPDGALYALASGAYPFRSTDGGATWERVARPGDDFSVASFTVAPDGTPDGTLLAVGPVVCTDECFHSGAWRSPDGGVTWTETGPPFTYGDVAMASGGLAVAVRADTVYRSADAGVTWVPSTVTGAPSVRDLALAEDGTVYALGASQGTAPLRLNPAATEWTPLPSPTDAALYTLAVGPEGALLLGTAAGAFRSEDGGETWAPLGMPEVGAYALQSISGGSILVGAERGVWAGTASGPFEHVGVASARVSALATGFAPDGHPLLVAGTWYQGVYTSRDRGQTWTLALDIDRLATDIVIGPDGAVWVATIGDLYRSTDGGETWEDLPRGGALRPLAVDGNGTAYVGYFGRPSVNFGIFRSSDGGQTWASIGFAGQAVHDLATDPDGAVYAVVGRELYRRDPGAAWQLLRSEMFAPTPGSDGLVLGSNSETIFRSEDRGETWAPVFTGGEGGWNLALRGSIAVARGDVGAIASLDGGQTWAPIAGELPPGYGSARDLALDADGVAYAGTAGDGVYRTVSAVATEGSTTESSSGLSVYPNPAERSATVALTLGERSTIRLVVYDVLGREVAVLADGAFEMGTHEVGLDAATLPSGVYLVRLVAGDRAATRRITVLR